MISTNRRLPVSLLLLRSGVAVVMLAWSIDKLLRPEHAAGVFGAFYGLPGLGEAAFYVIGTLQLLVVLAFLAGAWRT